MRCFMITVLLVISSSAFGQKNTTPIDSLHQGWYINYIFTIDVNAFLPVQDFRSTLNNSLGFGFYFGLPLNNKLRIDLGTSLFFPNERQPIQYLTKNEIFTGGTTISGTLGFWLTHVTPIGENWALDKRIGSGVGFFQTDIETGKPREDNDSVYGAETIFIGAGLGIKARVFNRNIGLKLEYFLVPYNLFKTRFPSNFGNSYFTLGMSFGF